MNRRPVFTLAILAPFAFVTQNSLAEKLEGDVRVVRSFAQTERFIFIYGFSKDGNKLLTGEGVRGRRDDSVNIWDIKSGQKKSIFRRKGRVVDRAAFLAEDKNVAVSLCREKELLVFDTDSGDLVSRIQRPEVGESWDVSPDKRKIVFYGEGKKALLWDIQTHREIRQFSTHGFHSSDILLTPDGKFVAFQDSDRSVYLYNTANGIEVRRFLDRNKDENHGGLNIAFSPDGKHLAVNSEESLPRLGFRSVICLWDVKNGELSKELRRPESPRTKEVDFNNSPQANWMCQGLSFSPDGKTLASAGSPKTQLWEVVTGKLRYEIHKQTCDICFSPDGTLLAAGVIHLEPRLRRGYELWDWRNTAEIQPRTLTAKDCEHLWSELASEDARRAFQAIGTLLANCRQAEKIIAGRVHRIEPLALDELDHLIADLDDHSFTVRERASARLASLGEAVRPALLQVKAQRPSLEVHRRIENIFRRLKPDDAPERLRCLRAIEVLEAIASTDAKNILIKLASGANGALETEDARAALRRLKSQRSPATNK